jgi:hypothetical protein
MFEHLKSIQNVDICKSMNHGSCPSFDCCCLRSSNWCLLRPDYTKPLNEPSWGDSGEEEDSDVDMDAEGILDGEDESDEYEDDMEQDEMVERIKAGKNGIMA